ncbi:DUF4333 domain-containing protein [Streptomyces sp. NPDC015171]|uniref:DUF4333 domain-containing protein n=1 Tax=Streptomyces sp. NPDC015171 TaxID=3364945 RepID=UPI0036FE8A51
MNDFNMPGHIPVEYALRILLSRSAKPEFIVPTSRLSTLNTVFSAIALSSLLVGCSVSAKVDRSTPKISANKLETTLSAKLAAATGQPKPKVRCPKDLAGRVGTTMRCELTADDGSTLGVSVKVTSVNDGQIKYDFAADDKASPPAN